MEAGICVMIVPGMIINGEKLNAMWNAGEDLRESKRFHGLQTIPYPKNWLETLKRSWISK